MKERHECPGVHVVMDLLLNEDWHLTDSDSRDRDHVTWAPESAVTIKSKFSCVHADCACSHQCHTISTHSSVWKQTPNLSSSDLFWFPSRLWARYWALTCPRGFNRGAGWQTEDVSAEPGNHGRDSQSLCFNDWWYHAVIVSVLGADPQQMLHR